ncbi:MAG: hypothetical protein Q9191_002026 [Dirinaria sp. TL-2023a]
MPSPPYRSPAGSPPYPNPAALPNANKRPSLSLAANPAPSKRRKSTFHSSVSTPGALHPLRQTSFPPEESVFSARSPSAETDLTGVTGGRSSTTAALGPKKRGRKRKTAGGSVKSDAKGKTGTVDGASLKEGDEGEEEEDEDEDPEGMVDEGDKIDKAKERERLAVLVGAFNQDQADRYDMYRRVKLRKETVRKIANQTLSQSVPPSVILTINGFTKILVATLTERAREVQEQYACQLPTPSADEARRAQTQSRPGTSSSTDIKLEPSSTDDVDDLLASPHATQSTQVASQSTQATSQETLVPPRKNDLGPLQPDQFREAFRRYKRDGEGGSVGMGGISLGLGIGGSGTARLSGRRLFR